MRRGTPMKYWGFYATDELRAQTIECAKVANESDSEYIRWAIIMRNQMQTGNTNEPKLIEQGDAQHKQLVMEMVEDGFKISKTQQWTKNFDEPVKDNTKKPDRQVQTFMKGGK